MPRAGSLVISDLSQPTLSMFAPLRPSWDLQRRKLMERHGDVKLRHAERGPREAPRNSS